MVNYKNVNGKKKTLEEMLEIIRDPIQNYELEGEIIVGIQHNVYCIIKQRSTKAINGREHVPRPTRCKIQFHTHPDFNIWPSVEDIAMILEDHMINKTYVIITRYGCWVMYANFEIEKGNIMNAIRNLNKFMGGYYAYVGSMYLSGEHEWSMEVENNVIEGFNKFSEEMERYGLNIKFYVMDNKRSHKKRLYNRLKMRSNVCDIYTNGGIIGEILGRNKNIKKSTILNGKSNEK
tara:strand:+ start:628 stop:1329 length:702 start_codon:yes stop_codon:yes gene_type:complete